MKKQGKRHPQSHPGGRPLKFKNAAELQKRIDAFFADCDPHEITEKYVERVFVGKENGLDKYEYKVLERPAVSEQRPYTITGLAVWLKTSRDVLLDYEEKYGETDPKFSNTIKAAKDKCHHFAENSLWKPGLGNAMQFNLTNNYKNWKTKQSLEHTGKDGAPLPTAPLTVITHVPSPEDTAG